MRTSVIYKMSDDEFSKLIKCSNSYCDVVKHFGLSTGGSGGFKVVKDRIKNLNLDCSHMRKAIDEARTNILVGLNKIDTNKILVENSTYANANGLKRRLVREGLLVWKCSRCNIDKWNEEEIALHLDHINGNKRDNRIENLRLLCPNCHSQTETYAGKKNKKHFCCKQCGGEIPNASFKQGRVCIKCSSILSRKVKNRPSKVELEKMIWQRPTSHIAKEYGVSSKAIEKWCKGYLISKPPRGYWMKKAKTKVL